MGSLEWALLKSKLDVIRIEYESLPSHLQAMFQACYTHEDHEAFEMACEAQCDEWKIVEEASIEPVPEPKPETKPEPKPEPKFVEIDFPNSSRLDQFKQGIDFEKCREGRIQATTQRVKNKRAQLIYKRRGALCIPEPMAVDDDEVSTTSNTASSSTVPATQGDVVVESAKPLTSLTPISSALDDESTIVSDSTEELNEWFPISLPAEPLASLTPISSNLDDESTIASASTEEMASWFPVEDKVAEPEIPSIVTIILPLKFLLRRKNQSTRSSARSLLRMFLLLRRKREEEYPFIGTIAEETLQEEEDVVFDTAGDDPFGIEVDDEVDQVTTVSDAEHESMVLFLAAFTTAADVPVEEEDETPAPIAIEPSTTMPVVHEDVAVEAPAQVAVEEPLLCWMPQFNSPIARPAGLRSLLSPHSMAIIGLSRRVDAIVGGSSLTSSVLAEWKYCFNLLMWVSIRISLLPTFLPACPHFTISYAI